MINTGIIKYYDIVNVESHDVLNIREFPGHRNQIIGTIPFNQTCVLYLDRYYILKSQVWVWVQYQEVQGWVNSYFLAENKRCKSQPPHSVNNIVE